MVISSRGRVALAVTLTILVIGGAIVLTLLRVQRWHELGWAGLNYMQANLPEKGIWGMKPGGVVMAHPDAPAGRAGLRQGDVLLKIDGVELKDVEGLRRVDRRVRTGDEVVFQARRGKTVRDHRVRFESPVRSSSVWLTGAVNVFVALTFVAIGLLVFTRSPDDRRSVVFYAMTVAGALSLIAGIVMLIDGSNSRGILTEPNLNLWVMAATVAFSFAFIPLILHLSLVFPKDRPVLINRPYILGWIYWTPVTALVLMTITVGAMTALSGTKGAEIKQIASVIRWILAGYSVATLILALTVIRRSRGESLRSAFLRRPTISIMLALGILLGFATIGTAFRWGVAVGITTGVTSILPFLATALFPVFTCISLYRSYREAGLEERRQVKWPLWGILIAVGSKIVFTIVMYAITTWVMASHGDLGSWMPFMKAAQLIPTICYLLIPISFAVAILKYRLMNIDLIIKKTVAYAILSGAIIILYLVLVGGLGTLLVNVAGVKNTTTVIGSTLVVAALFVPLRNKLQSLVDRNLFRQKYDYPQALRAISADTMGARDLALFLGGATEKMQQALQNRAVVVFAPRGSDFVATAKVGVPDNILGTQRLSAATVASFDRPLDPRRRTLPDADAAALKKVDAALVVPVRSQGEARSLIALAPKLSDREFDLEDIEFISSAADQIAIGIDRIRTQLDEADFDQARRMQQTLLPAEAPEMSGLDVAGIWQPARAVGGDYYDLLKLSETRLAVCIGDVAGKGMPAALLMSGLQAAVRASATEDAPPSEVVERVRRVVVPSLGGRFVTFFYCVIDTAAHSVRYCNAGHNQPIVVRADGTTMRLLTSSPVLSRLFKAAPLQNGELELHSGDRLVLFTDGVSESRDGGENEYGEDRLAEFVAAHRDTSARDLASQIAAEVSAFSGGRADDDLTLVAVAVS